MKIIFETDQEGTTYALSKNETWRGRWHDELLWCEINKKENVYYLLWEDSYPNKQSFSTEELARTEVLRSYTSHKPHSNGASYDINEI